jgi:hypothetical protein
MSDVGEEKMREGWSYSGEVWTDAAGRAVVALPPFVRLHRDGFDYELTPLADGCEATVAEAIAGGRFAIATSEPHVKVAWRVTPLREKPGREGSGR